MYCKSIFYHKGKEKSLAESEAHENQKEKGDNEEDEEDEENEGDEEDEKDEENEEDEKSEKDEKYGAREREEDDSQRNKKEKEDIDNLAGVSCEKIAVKVDDKTYNEVTDKNTCEKINQLTIHLNDCDILNGDQLVDKLRDLHSGKKIKEGVTTIGLVISYQMIL